MTSSSNDWSALESVYVVVVESEEDGRMYGGSRVHIADGIHHLPIENAVGEMDESIYEMVKTNTGKGTGEQSCGLWNSLEVAGLGIGAIFTSRAALAIAPQIGLTTIFSLCSPVTVKFSEWQGGRVIKDLGNNGTFYYPKHDLLATAVFVQGYDQHAGYRPLGKGPGHGSQSISHAGRYGELPFPKRDGGRLKFIMTWSLRMPMPMNSVMVRVLKYLALILYCNGALGQNLIIVRSADKLQSAGLSALHAEGQPR